MSLQVLLVDDEALARSRLRTLLADCTAPTASVAGEAANSAQAMELLLRVRFDVVLLDIHMPVMGGLETLSEIRERGVSILLVEQRAQLTIAFADRTHVIANGKLRLTLGPHEAGDIERLTAAYLS